jgi:hypothetical protein
MVHELMIHPVTKSYAKAFWFFKTKKIVQNNRADFGVEIENISKKSFPGGKLNNVHLKPQNSSFNFKLGCEDEYNIVPLNPKEKTILWLDNSIFSTDGGYFLKMDIKSNDGKEIKSYKRDDLDQEKHKIPSGPVEWHKNIFVHNESSLILKTTNYLLLMLTLILLLDQIFGMDVIFSTLFNILGGALETTGHAIKNV